MARVIFVNRFYWPDETATGQLLTDLAEALVEHGHAVTVIASRPGPSRHSGVTERHGVRVVHVGSSRMSHGNLGSKALDFGTFFFGACWTLLRHARRDTIVVAMTDPPLIGVGAWLVARLRGARLLQWVQDIYPELAVELAGQSWLRALRPLRNAAWRGADHCVTLGTDMAARLRAAKVADDRRSVIPNWAPKGVSPAAPDTVNELRAAWELAGKFVVAYSGNLGRVHDLDALLGLADALRERTDIRFVVVGGGAQRSRIEASAAHRRLPNIAFHPPQPRARLAAALGLADVHLVTLRAGCEDLVFPSKLYGIAAIGRPVIFIGPEDCEVARAVTGGGFGFAARREDIASLAAAIRRLADAPAERSPLAAAALRFAAAHDGKTAAARWSDLLTRVEGSHAGHASHSEVRKP